MSAVNRLRRNFVYATIASASNVLLLAVLILAARRLGDDTFGQFSFAVALATIGESLMDWGLHQVAIRSVARDRGSAPAIFRNSATLKLAPSVAMVAVLTLVACWAKPQHDLRVACFLLAVSALMRSYLLTVRGVLQGLERFGTDSLVVVLDRVLLLAFSAAALLSGGRLVALGGAFVLARTIAVAAALALSRRHVGSLTPSFDTALWKDLGRSALPLGAFLIVLNLYSYIDTVMLSVMSTDRDTGLYNAAYRIYEGVTYGAAILSAVLTPRLSAEFTADRRRFGTLARRGFAGSLAMAVVLAAAAALLAAWGLRVLFGGDFTDAARALQILAGGLLVVYPIWILQAVAIATSTERVLLRTTAIGVIVNVGANLFLIPAAGRNGAALATVIGEAISLVLLLYGLRWAFIRPPSAGLQSRTS